MKQVIRQWKRVLSIVLTVAMMVTMVPQTGISVMAAEVTDESSTNESALTEENGGEVTEEQEEASPTPIATEEEGEPTATPAEEGSEPTATPAEEGSEPTATPTEAGSDPTETPVEEAVPTEEPEASTSPAASETPTASAEATASPGEEASASPSVTPTAIPSAAPSATPEAELIKARIGSEGDGSYISVKYISGFTEDKGYWLNGEDIVFALDIAEDRTLAKVGYYFSGDENVTDDHYELLGQENEDGYYVIPYSEIPEGTTWVNIYVKANRFLNFNGTHVKFLDRDSGEELPAKVEHYVSSVYFKLEVEEGYKLEEVYVVNDLTGEKVETLEPDSYGTYCFGYAYDATIYAVAKSVEVKMAPTYWTNGTKQPFLAQFENLELEDSYSAEIRIDGELREGWFGLYANSGQYNMLVCEDIGAVEPGQHKVQVTLFNSSNEQVVQKEETVNFATEENYILNSLSSDDIENVSIDIYSSKAVSKVELLDKDGAVRAKNISTVYHASYAYEERYEEYFDTDYYLDSEYGHYTSTLYFSKVPEAGDYDCRVTFEDDTVKIFENAYSIGSKAVILDVSNKGSVTNSDQSTFLIAIDAVGVDPDKITPVLYDLKGNKVTSDAVLEKKSNMGGDVEYVYRMTKAKASVWDIANVWYTFKFDVEVKDGYEVTFAKGCTKEISIPLNKMDIGNIYYNGYSQAEPYYLSVKNYDASGSVDIIIYEYDTYIGTATDAEYILASKTMQLSEVKDGMLNFELLTPDGQPFRAQQNQDYDVVVDAKDAEGNYITTWQTSYIGVYGLTQPTSISGMISATKSIWGEGVKQIPIKYNVADEALLSGKTEWTAYLTKTRYDGTTTIEECGIIGEKVVLTLDDFELAGTWTNTEGLTSGSYYLTVFRNGASVSHQSMTVVTDKGFYFLNLYGTKSGSQIQLQVNAPTVLGGIIKKYGEDYTAAEVLAYCKANLRLSAYEVESGKSISGLSMASASVRGATLLIMVNGMPNDYRCAYMKLTDSEGNDPTNGPNSDVSFYSTYYNCDPVYGAFITFRLYNTFYSNGTAYTGVTLAKVEDSQYPVSLNIYPIDDEKLLKTITVKKSATTSGRYNFTEKDLEGLDPTMPYAMEIIGADKMRLSYAENYFAPFKAVIGVSGITADKTKLYLAAGATGTINVEVKPANAFNTDIIKRIADDTVASFTEDGSILALKPGQTEIQYAARANTDKMVSCMVYVADLNKKELNLAVGESDTLKIETGDSAAWSTKWSSSDTSVATVSTAGKVTAMGNGSATITAVANGVTFTCEVTVSTPLTGVAFNKDALNLTVGETGQVAVKLIPANAQVNLKDDSLVSLSLETEEGEAATIADYEVSEDGSIIKVTAKAAGTASLSITIGEFSAKIPVNVKEVFTAPDVSDSYLVALTNLDLTLADLEDELDALFAEIDEEAEVSFKDSSVSLKSFAGANEKEFAVVYEKDGESVQTSVRVKFLTITGLTVAADKTTLDLTNNKVAQITATPVVSGASLTEEELVSQLSRLLFTAQVQEKKVSRVSASMENGTYVLNIAATAEGTESVKVLYCQSKVTTTTNPETGEPVQAIVADTAKVVASGSVKVTVAPKALAEIALAMEGEGLTEGTGAEDYRLKGNASTLTLLVNGSYDEYKITLKSSDKKVASIGTLENGRATLTITGSGYAEITATANDKAKTTATTLLYVQDNSFYVDNAATMNLAAEDVAALIHIYPGQGITADESSLALLSEDGSAQNLFKIAATGEANVYKVYLNGEPTESKYTLKVALNDTEGNALKANTNLAIKLENKAPSVTVKAANVNGFYQHTDGVLGSGEGLLTVSAKNMTASQIAEVSVDEASILGYDEATGALYVKDTTSLVKGKTTTIQLKVTVTCEGYKSVEKTVKVKVSYSAPALTYSKNATVYQGLNMDAASVTVTDKKAKLPLVLTDADISQPDFEKDAYEVTTDEKGTLVFTLKEGKTPNKKGDKITVNLKCDGWQYEVPVTVTVKVNAKTNAKMKAKLSKTSLELNTNAKYAELQQLETVLSIDGISYEEYQSISVGASDAKALEMQQNLQFKTDAANGKITVRVTDAQKLAQALANKQKSFAYQVTVKLTSGTTATAKLTIKLKETVSDKVITVKTKGNIDVLDRSSSVTLTPKMSGIAGQIIDVDLQGRDAHLFDAVVNDNGTVSVYPKEGISYITKYNYLIKPVFTIDNGYMSFEAEPKADLKIKLKQGSIKKPAAQKIFLSAKSDDAYTGTLEFLNAKGETAEIKDIKLIAPKGMNGVMTLEVGADGKSYTLRHTDGRGKLVAGKSYKYNLEVRLVNQGDNEKPIKVAMTITMK